MPSRGLTISSLNRKYDKYVVNYKAELEKHNYELPYQEEWAICRDAVYTRDNHKCRLWRVLTLEEKQTAIESGCIKIITPAHVIARSISRKLICSIDNVYTMYLTFHERMEHYNCPLTGKFVGRAITRNWWKRIIGVEVLEWLEGNK